MRRLKELLRFLRRHWAGAVKYYKFNIADQYSKKNWVLVYTMGKVGSSTIADSLKYRLKNYYTFHIHWLLENNLKTDKNFYKTFFIKNQKRGIPYVYYPEYILQGFYLNGRIKQLKSFHEKDLKIITLTREPVSRNISSFFQNVELFFGYSIKDKLNEMDVTGVADELILLFRNKFIKYNTIDFLDGDPLTWFDEEMRKVIGVDVYSKEFPMDKGFDIYRNGKTEVLLIRLEDLSKCYPEATEALFGSRLYLANSKNLGRNKAYASVYKEFKKRIQLPEWYLNQMYDSKYSRHFYSNEEIKNFQNKWIDKSKQTNNA